MIQRNYFDPFSLKGQDCKLKCKLCKISALKGKMHVPAAGYPSIKRRTTPAFRQLVGGGASLGTVALNEAEKVRELEQARQKLIRLSNSIDPGQLIPNGPREDSARYGYEERMKLVEKRKEEVKKLTSNSRPI